MTPPHPFSLEGKVALVTGSTKGLGRAIAMALGAAGAKVCLNYANSREKAEAAFDEFTSAGYEGCLVRADVTDEADVNKLCAEAASKLGPIDVLVPNATCDQPHKPIEEYDWAFHQNMVDFFLKSPFLLTRAVLPSMKQRRKGRIVNIGSEVFSRGVPNFSAYVAAKGAQHGWSRSMANELAPFGITVNVVDPGWIPVARHDNDPQEEKDGYRALIPMNRWGVPDDVGGAIVFLASDAASFVTGQAFAVNGGMTVG
ncbi:MAG: 3-oxoacyl-ACP reductase family protein [Planctomycetota bacterium]